MSPRTKKQFEEIREERKALIMNTALEHFAREGYHSATISHIARHAGISKGLMYNYFESKEALLAAIIQRSVTEVYKDFDMNRDGFLSEDEFVNFIRRIALVLSENRSFWRLFFQLMMQKEVREELLNLFLGSGSLIIPFEKGTKGLLLSDIMSLIYDYFGRKRNSRNTEYDPRLEMNMFIITIKGFALTYIFSDDEDKEFTEKTINRIIETFK
ncbi:MAG: TetR/AcrR family transcriptional regulator [Bacteroidales bacterium]|jgi:AcrR family transcriptional regulator|nr:TetR/AcrR family transcriptional regulator [Bacteroidales bacterium]MCU0407671.1 TetR/AcrR family transcriptional regulator [Bacteroidales bacterium]